MANPRTVARIAARIKERIAYCIEFELSDPRGGFITITNVEVTPDLASARVSFSVLGSAGERSRAEHMLADASGYIQRQVARVLRTRRVPRLQWKYDDSVEYAAHMDQAIREALRRDRAINPEAHDTGEVFTGDEDEDAEIAVEYEEFLEDEDAR